MKKFLSRLTAGASACLLGATSALASEPTLDVTGAMSGMTDKVITAGNAALPVVVSVVGIFIVYRIIKRA
jgi:hypothetical protein